MLYFKLCKKVNQPLKYPTQSFYLLPKEAEYILSSFLKVKSACSPHQKRRWSYFNANPSVIKKCGGIAQIMFVSSDKALFDISSNSVRLRPPIIPEAAVKATFLFMEKIACPLIFPVRPTKLLYYHWHKENFLKKYCPISHLFPRFA